MRRRTQPRIVARFGVDPEACTVSKNLQNGGKIAKSGILRVDILIMDEPTSALTDREVDHLFKIHSAPSRRGQRDRLHHSQE